MSLKGIKNSLIKRENRNKSSKKDTSIKFERDNMIKCLCIQCTVQKDSECAQNKNKMLQISMRGMSPEPEEYPGMYCANGKAVCEDLNFNKKCKCVQCEVWKENNLELKQPNTFFCQNGK